MLNKLKKAVCSANMELPEHGLVNFTWGNVSGINRKKELMVIKPSGIDYDALYPEIMVVVDMDGNVLEGVLNPSVDTAAHLYLYKAFPDINGIVHTHSTWATIFAQCGKDIPAFGTTHADYFFGNIPCTRALSSQEIEEDYEKNTGLVIAETFKKRKLDPKSMPGVIVKNHGPFAWGESPEEAVKNAAILDIVAHMAYHTQILGDGKTRTVAKNLLSKHYERKHGSSASYGQR